LQYLWRALRWALKHPFALHPLTWLLLVAAWLAVAFVLVSGSVTVPLPDAAVVAVMACALAIMLVALFAWSRLSRPSGLLLIFLSRFRTLDSKHESDATTHALKVRQGLDACRPLVSAAELRSIGAALTRSEAARLLDAASAQAVVFGQILVAGSEMEVQAEILRQRPPTDPREQSPVPANRRDQLAPEHRVFTDPGIPLVNLVRGSLNEQHAAWIQQELLAIVAPFPVEQ
jgi:hypothetical protein